MKPRLYMQGGVWWCMRKGNLHKGIGYTPREAFISHFLWSMAAL